MGASFLPVYKTYKGSWNLSGCFLTRSRKPQGGNLLKNRGPEITISGN